MIALNQGDKILYENLKNQALNYLTQALSIVETYFPTDSPHIERIRYKAQKMEKTKASGNVYGQVAMA